MKAVKRYPMAGEDVPTPCQHCDKGPATIEISRSSTKEHLSLCDDCGMRWMEEAVKQTGGAM